jgi:hypothetical protein
VQRLTNSSARQSPLLGWEVMDESRTNAPATPGPSSVRLNPQNRSAKGRFLFLVDGVRTNGAIRFSVTVAPNASDRSPQVAAHLLLINGEGMMVRKELKDLQGSGEAFRYEFQVAPSLLANSRFVLRDLEKGKPKDLNNGDSFWFCLGDFVGHNKQQ